MQKSIENVMHLGTDFRKDFAGLLTEKWKHVGTKIEQKLIPTSTSDYLEKKPYFGDFFLKVQWTEVGDKNGDVLRVLPENIRQIVIGALCHDLEICGRDGTWVGDLMRVHETEIGRPISASNPCGPSR